MAGMDFDTVRERALKAIYPLKAADTGSLAPRGFLFEAKRTEAGRTLPPYYLVYFLLIDLLGFKNLGHFDKVAWSVPVEYEGKAFLIEHRKFGLGVFASDLPSDEPAAAEITKLIHRAVRVARPYFEWRAEQAAKASQLNVVNRSRELFARLEFYLHLYRERQKEAEDRKGERVETGLGEGRRSVGYLTSGLKREARWFALSAIESFFSWTEHVFIHIAILQGNCLTGEDVADLAKADWAEKFKAALNVATPSNKSYYDQLVIVRRQLRNFVAHGAFGKGGEAFSFHSAAGAVPMILPHRHDHASFRFGRGVDFVASETISLIEAFVEHLWSGSRAPAKIYIQDYELPLVLTKAADGTYARAMESVQSMTEYAYYEASMRDRYMDMDF